MKLMLSAEESENKSDYLFDLSNLRIEILELNKCNQSLMEKAEEISKFSEQTNAKMLTKFFILNGSFIDND